MKKMNKVFSTVTAMVMLSGSASFPAMAKENTIPDFSSLGAVGVLTEEQTVMAAQSIYEGLESHKKVAVFNFGDNTITPSTEAFESLGDLFGAIASQYEVGILANRHSLGICLATYQNTPYISGVNIAYQVEDNYDTIYAQTIAQLDDISAQVHEEWSPVEKALFLHDYIAVQYNYTPNYDTGNKNYLEYSAYGMLTRGYAVCEGYAWLYSILMNREGIETKIVSSDALWHVWNVVHINDEWFYVDITWDDSRQRHAGLVSHESCLKGYNAMQESGHNSDDWELLTGEPVSNLNVSERYDNGFWSKSNSAVQIYQGKWLAVVSGNIPNAPIGYFNLYDYDAETETAEYETLTVANMIWLSMSGNSYYPGTWCVPVVYDDVIFYSYPDSILAWMDGETQVVYTVPDEQKELGNIYGLHTDGNQLYYDISATPSGEVQEYSVSIAECLSNLYGTEVIITPTETTTEETTTSTATSEETTETSTTTEETITTTSTASATTTAETTTTTETTTETMPMNPVPFLPETTTVTEMTTESTTSVTTETSTATEESTTISLVPFLPIEAVETSAEDATEASETTEVTVIEEMVEEIETVLYGDIDGDEEISETDIILLSDYLLCKSELTDIESTAADLNHDGEIDAFDLALAKRAFLNSME